MFKKLFFLAALLTVDSITLSAMEPQDPDTRTPETSAGDDSFAHVPSKSDVEMAAIDFNYPGYSKKLLKFSSIIMNELALPAYLAFSLAIASIELMNITQLQCRTSGLASYPCIISSIKLTPAVLLSLLLVHGICTSAKNIENGCNGFKFLVAAGYQGKKDFIAAWRKYKTRALVYISSPQRVD